MDLFGSAHITGQRRAILALLFILGYIVIFHVMVKLTVVSDGLNNFCMAQCETKKCDDFVAQTKGTDYYVTEKTGISMADTKKCLVGFWELSHFVTHVFIGYYYNLAYSLGFGVAFEVLERYQWNCESYMDIAFNTAGAVLGIYLRS